MASATGTYAGVAGQKPGGSRGRLPHKPYNEQFMSSGPDPDRWSRLEEVFHEAAELPADRLAEFLDRECAGDPELRCQAEQLLAQDRAGATVVRLVEHVASDLSGEQDRRWIGQRLGAWQVTGVLGRGGMGAVFAVERADGTYSQRAALKLLRWDLNTASGRMRFTEERQILARLQHPNIARLLDGGSTPDGRPWIVMELVEGRPIHEYAETQRLNLAERLCMVITVCHAVSAAHAQLIIHRDLKPVNILVASDGTVKLLDFGIAKFLDRQTGSAATDHCFSPSYASPEQVRGEHLSTATDVYSLGAVLYQLLTGKAPREISGLPIEEMKRAVCDEPFPTPSAGTPLDVRRRLRGDLDAVIAKATDPDPIRRYPSAERMGADLERYLERRPLEVRSGSPVYRTGKFLLRNAAASAVVAVLLAALIGATAYSAIQANRAERRFAQVRQLANRFLFEFHDQIRDLQGSTAARENVVRTGLAYLDSLAAESHRDRGLELELASAYDKVAAVQFRVDIASLGRPKDAAVNRVKAIAIRQRWLAREPRNAGLHAEQAASYLRLAEAEAGLKGLTEITQAYDQGAEHGEAARHLARPVTPGILRTLAELYQARGLTVSRQGNVAGAVESYGLAHGIYQELAGGMADPEARIAAGDSRIRLGLALYNVSRQQEAERELRAAVRDLEAVSRDLPDNRRARRAWFSACFTFGGVLMNQLLAIYNPREAAAMFAQGLALAQTMAEDERDVNAQRDLATSHCQYGSALQETDAYAAAREYAAGIRILRKLIATAPDRKDLARVLASHLPGYAGVLAGLGKPEAIPAAREAVELVRALRESSPDSLQARRLHLMTSLALAGVQLEIGHAAAAAGTLAAVGEVAETGSPAQITQSLLHDRIQFYSLSYRAAARTRSSDANAWRARFDEALNELVRRSLGGPFAARQQKLLAR